MNEPQDILDRIMEMTLADQLRMAAEMLDAGHDRLARVLCERVVLRLTARDLGACGFADPHILCTEGRPCSAGCPR